VGFRRGIAIASAWLLLFVCCCTSYRSETAYAAKLPPDVRPSFDVFAQRCSKCHSLSRPLDSGIDDDAYWQMYVRRMRLQPGSGISQNDEKIILEFLHYYAKERRERKTQPPPAVVDAAAADVIVVVEDAGGGT